MIHVVQIGLGPLGQKINQYISDRTNVKVVAAVDKNPQLIGHDLGEICNGTPSKIIIKENLQEALKNTNPDVAILSTVSDMNRITEQIMEILSFGIPIVSTCEELSYPWNTNPTLADKIDMYAKEKKLAVVGTGVNPGFLMDALPSFLTAVCQNVDFIEVNRFQDATFRRIPFQQKIGAGLSLETFEEKKQNGTLRHVGLTESIQLIANQMGWTLSKTEDIIEPVVAEEYTKTKEIEIEKGAALGVTQIGRGYIGNEVKILLKFKAAIGVQESYDEVNIKGIPNIQSKISGGVNGDIATCAIVINALPQIIRSTAGLKTMADIPLVSYFS